MQSSPFWWWHKSIAINKSLKRLNKLLNIDLKNLTNWFNADNILLNVSKTGLIIFKIKRKPLDFNMKIKLMEIDMEMVRDYI